MSFFLFLYTIHYTLSSRDWGDGATDKQNVKLDIPFLECFRPISVRMPCTFPSIWRLPVFKWSIKTGGVRAVSLSRRIICQGRIRSKEWIERCLFHFCFLAPVRSKPGWTWSRLVPRSCWYREGVSHSHVHQRGTVVPAKWSASTAPAGKSLRKNDFNAFNILLRMNACRRKYACRYWSQLTQRRHGTVNATFLDSNLSSHLDSLYEIVRV